MEPVDSSAPRKKYVSPKDSGDTNSKEFTVERKAEELTEVEEVAGLGGGKKRETKDPAVDGTVGKRERKGRENDGEISCIEGVKREPVSGIEEQRVEEQRVEEQRVTKQGKRGQETEGENFGAGNLIEKRKRIAYREANISTALNIVLFVIKIALGIMISSIALTADAFHTLSDISTSIVILLSFKAASKAPDQDHPFGHGRWEPIATLIISVMLVVAGIELMVQGVKAGISGSHGEANLLVAGVVMITALSKEWLARYAMKLGNEIDSSSLKADAWHHRTDALSSVGVALAIVFSDRIPMVDGIAAVLVSLLIMKTGISFILRTSHVLLGQAPSEKTLDLICEIALAEPGVMDVHGILIHDYVSTRSISLDIVVNRNLTVSEAHVMADRVSRRIRTELQAMVTVHVDPADE